MNNEVSIFGNEVKALRLLLEKERRETERMQTYIRRIESYVLSSIEDKIEWMERIDRSLKELQDHHKKLEDIDKGSI